MDAVTDSYSVQEWCRGGAQVIYQGIVCQQFRSDMDRYGQIIRELAPPFIIEVGRADGGTALFLADELAKVRDDGIVISIDIIPPKHGHPRIRHLTGNSIDTDTIMRIHELTAGRGLILLDGDHASKQVAVELELYAGLADYLVVEDTIMRELPMFDDGPYVALDRWLRGHPEFVLDPDPIPTQHPGGWLRRTL